MKQKRVKTQSWNNRELRKNAPARVLDTRLEQIPVPCCTAGTALVVHEIPKLYKACTRSTLRRCVLLV